MIMACETLVLALIRAARPTFRNQNDKIAFVVHSSFLVSGYVLTATGPHALSDNALSDPSNDEVSVDHWNELNDEYAFVYAIPEKDSEKVLVKCLVMNDKLLVHALSQGSSQPLSLEINVGDYAGEDGGSNYSQHFKNLDKLVKKIDDDVLFKLDGSDNASSSSRSSESIDRTRQEIPEPVTGFGEPSGLLNHPIQIIYPTVLVGSDYRHLVFGNPAGVLPLRGGHCIGGSMLVGPGDIHWYGDFGSIGGDPAFPEGLSGVPPGAQFDLYGPPGVPGFEVNRFARNPRRPGYDNHPDLLSIHIDAVAEYI